MSNEGSRFPGAGDTDPNNGVGGNVHEYTVGALSGAIKRSLEDEFGFVRVKGELGRVTRAGSGHLYLDLKDEKAVLSGVVWKGAAQKLRIKPEQGMEVVATGRISTFPGQSRYQLIIDNLEPAGVGALMALLEERKKKLAAEGLFAPERKKAPPFLPDVIGVVTSPSGAVIRDILHRVRDRFPCRVIVWPTLVQGKGAENTIAAAIQGFNALPADGPVPRPDVLIVARGGGSLEDLWCFNEEVVVRAAAQSAIPLISAVGHETDTTLIDYASDKRAPTPTAAAELATPVRTELLAELMNKARRLLAGESRLLENARAGLLAASRGLGRPEDITMGAAQRLDRAGDRLVAQAKARLAQAETRLAAQRLSPAAVQRLYTDRTAALARATARLPVTAKDGLTRKTERLARFSQLLEALSHKSALMRGFALVHGADGALMRSSSAGVDGDAVRLVFADGERGAVLGPDAPTSPAPPMPSAARAKKQTKPAAAAKAKSDNSSGNPSSKAVQKSLFDE